MPCAHVMPRSPPCGGPTVDVPAHRRTGCSRFRASDQAMCMFLKVSGSLPLPPAQPIKASHSHPKMTPCSEGSLLSPYLLQGIILG